MKKYISSLRLRTLPLAVSGVSFGAFACILVGEPLKLWLLLLTILTTLFLQTVSNLGNEIGDYVKGTDKDRVGPKYGIESGQVKLTSLKRLLYFFIACSAVSGLLLVGFAFQWTYSRSFFYFLLLGLAAVLAALGYTMGKHPYGYMGLGDIFVFVFFGLVAVAGSFFLQTKVFSMQLVPFVFIIGLWNVAVLNVNNTRDIENDKASHKNTVPVFLGLKWARIYQAFLILTPLLIAAAMGYYLVLWSLPIWSIHLYFFFTLDHKKLNKQLPVVSFTTLLCCILLIIALYN